MVAAVAVAWFTYGLVQPWAAGLIIDAGAGATFAAAAAVQSAAAIGGAMAGGFAGGFAGGLVASGGDFKAAAIGGVVGGLSGFIGASAAFGAPGINTGRVIAHGVVGGASAEARGGKFIKGFMSAVFTKSISNDIQRMTGNDPIAGSVAAAVVGGTASSIAGGKFANGASTAAFAYMFNQMGSSLVDNTKMMWKGLTSVFTDIKTAIGHAGAYYYSGACSALTGSSECTAVYNLVRDDAGRIGGAIYDFIHNPEVRKTAIQVFDHGVSAAITYQDVSRNYVGGRALGGMAVSLTPRLQYFGILAVPGSMLRASQTYGNAVNVGHMANQFIGINK